jgi:hypothetical protein
MLRRMETSSGGNADDRRGFRRLNVIVVGHQQDRDRALVLFSEFVASLRDVGLAVTESSSFETFDYRNGL